MKIPLPQEEYMSLVCGGAKPFPNLETHYLEVGKWLLSQLKAYELIGSSTTFLDVGCGCGRVARVLLNESLNSYVGFDRHLGMIQWCQREITSRDARFQFHWFDIKSSYEDGYENRGSIDARRFHFPFSPKTFDTCLLASVFTHMPFDEVVHYLDELFLVTRPGGRVFLSVFFASKGQDRQGINYFHDQTSFLAAVEQGGFRWELKGTLVKGKWVNDQTSTGVEQNWYLLTKPSDSLSSYEDNQASPPQPVWD